MVLNKSLDEYILIEHLLRDAHVSWSSFFNARALRLTCLQAKKRVRSEGLGFLTKTLPRLGKCLDQVLAGATRMTCTELGFDALPGTNLPRFLGEFFIRVLQPSGEVLPNPDIQCVSVLRQILYLFYKYELPYTETQTQRVIDSFKQTEDDLGHVDVFINSIVDGMSTDFTRSRRRPLASEDLNDPLWYNERSKQLRVVREARIALSRLFSTFDGYDIIPRHGPGIVSTKERLGAKYLWRNVSSRITDVYPFDEYFCSSQGHVCDTYNKFSLVTDKDHSAQVILVPKDSRGPRLISCEPVDFQWIQQGLRKAIYELVETSPQTRFNVFFTNQAPNQYGALLGSRFGGSNHYDALNRPRFGKYATLDLKEASDRVSISLVHLLFPSHLHRFLDAARSVSTVLPNGEKIILRKFAPMGSALCFPIMALTIWALLTASAPDEDTRESILVYGDDVIVPTAFAESAMGILEVFGLKINRTKSCLQGSFRESCGVDAFQGVDVTPVRIRTVWNSSPRPDVYTSWIAYANQFWDKRLYHAYNYIVAKLEAIYGPIPGEDMLLACPSLRSSSARSNDFKRKLNKDLQKVQYRVRVESSSSVTQVLPGWNMLLRYFVETANSVPFRPDEYRKASGHLSMSRAFAVSQYTKRHTSILVWRWR
jgi:hypothetical protein